MENVNYRCIFMEKFFDSVHILEVVGNQCHRSFYIVWLSYWLRCVDVRHSKYGILEDGTSWRTAWNQSSLAMTRIVASRLNFRTMTNLYLILSPTQLSRFNSRNIFIRRPLPYLRLAFPSCQMKCY